MFDILSQAFWAYESWIEIAVSPASWMTCVRLVGVAPVTKGRVFQFQWLFSPKIGTWSHTSLTCRNVKFRKPTCASETTSARFRSFLLKGGWSCIGRLKNCAQEDCPLEQFGWLSTIRCQIFIMTTMTVSSDNGLCFWNPSFPVMQIQWPIHEHIECEMIDMSCRIKDEGWKGSEMMLSEKTDVRLEFLKCSWS